MWTSPPLDGPGPAPVAADDGGGLQLAGGDHLAHLPPDARGLDADHLALLDICRDGVVGGAQAGGGDGQILQPQLLDGGGHHQVDHVVPVPQVVVEGEGHAVPGSALLQRLGQRGYHLGVHRLLTPTGAGGGLLEVLAVHVVLALVDLLAVLQEVVRDLASNCVLHCLTPPRRTCRRRGPASTCAPPRE